jgi:biopolymer transport protein ExbB
MVAARTIILDPMSDAPGFIEQVVTAIRGGGPVMVPIAALSVLSVGVTIERTLYWRRIHDRGSVDGVRSLTEALREGNAERVRGMIEGKDTPYAVVTRRLLEKGAGDGVAVEAVEESRGAIDRFLPLLSTIVAAAPLLGVLGTVFGIIRSFKVLGAKQTLVDPSEVSGGIAEALTSTAAGLCVAIFALFAASAFRGQAEKAIGRLEGLIAAAQQGFGTGPRRGA